MFRQNWSKIAVVCGVALLAGSSSPAQAQQPHYHPHPYYVNWQYQQMLQYQWMMQQQQYYLYQQRLLQQQALQQQLLLNQQMPAPVVQLPLTQPQFSQPQVSSSTWAGSEDLQGYGQLTFQIQGSRVTMIDAQGSHAGSVTRSGSQVTLHFPGIATYTGVMNGQEMSGNARDSTRVWNWSVSCGQN